MQIIIKIADGETFTLEVNNSDTIIDVKNQIEKRTGVLPWWQRFRLRRRVLRDHEKLSDYNVQNGTQLDLLLG